MKTMTIAPMTAPGKAAKATNHNHNQDFDRLVEREIVWVEVPGVMRVEGPAIPAVNAATRSTCSCSG